MKILERPLYIVREPVFSTQDNFDYSAIDHISSCQRIVKIEKKLLNS